MKIKSKFSKVLLVFSAYVVIAATILASSTIEKISREDIESLNLSGKTVNQVEEILKSEGYKKNDYLLITDSGQKPGKGWQIDHVENSRISRIFVKTEKLPSIESLKIVGLRLTDAEKALERVGYFPNENYVPDFGGESVWFKNIWEVKSVDESNASKAPKVKFEKVASLVDQNSKTNSSNSSSHSNTSTTVESNQNNPLDLITKTPVDIQSLIGKRLSEARDIFTQANWTRSDYSYETTDGSIVLLQSNWNITKVEEISGKPKLTVERF